MMAEEKEQEQTFDVAEALNEAYEFSHPSYPGILRVEAKGKDVTMVYDALDGIVQGVTYDSEGKQEFFTGSSLTGRVVANDRDRLSVMARIRRVRNAYWTMLEEQLPEEIKQRLEVPLRLY